MFTALFFLKFIGLILSYAHSNLSSMQLLEMVEKNEINRSLLPLLDENIASAQLEKNKITRSLLALLSI